MTFLKTVLLVAAAAVFLAGCSTEKSTETKLTFILTQSDGKPISKTVACPEDISCETILAVPGSAWEPVPPNTPCTKIYGGPDRLSVGGKIQGESVLSNFSLAGGCEINRWNEIEPLLKEVFGSDYKGSRFATV